MKKKQIFVISMFLLLNSMNSALADKISFEATVDRNKVSVGDRVQLNLSFHNTKDVPTPYFPGVDGFNWQYLGPTSLTSIINGQVSSSITHRYILVALRKGSFEIPAFSIQFRGKTYTSNPIPIEVVQGQVTPTPGGQRQPVQIQAQDFDDQIFLILQVDKKKAYVNEIIPVKIKAYISNLAIENIQYPKIAQEGFVLDKFAEPKQYQENLKGVVYNVIEFNTNIFALRPGQLKLGPAQIPCKLLVKQKSDRRFRSFFDDFFDDDFFARYKSYPISLKSIDIPFTIMALPEDGKPADFDGALGDFQFSLQANPKQVKVGDPITLIMTISGVGNFKTVNPPQLKFKDDFKVYDSEVKQDSSSKTFEQVVIPKNEKIQEIPEISFHFFDTKSGQYKRITKGPIAMTVSPLPPGEQLQVFEISEEGTGVLRKKEVFGRDIIYIKDNPDSLKKKGEFLCKNRLFILLQFIPLIAIVAALVFQRRRQRLQTDIGYARRLRAPGEAKKNLLMARRLLDSKAPYEFFDAVFKTLQEYLGDRFHLPTAGITADVISELKLRAVDQLTLEKIEECFRNCDLARYAPSSISKEQMLATFHLLEEIIDQLERMKR